MLLVLVGSAFAGIWPKNRDSSLPLDIKSSGRLPQDFLGAGETHRTRSHLGSHFAGLVLGKGRSDAGHDPESGDEDNGRSNTSGGNWHGAPDANGPGQSSGVKPGDGDSHFGSSTGYFPAGGFGGTPWSGLAGGSTGKGANGDTGGYGDPGQNSQNHDGDGSKDSGSDPGCTNCGPIDDTPPGFSSKDGDLPQDLSDDPGCTDCDLPPPGNGLVSDPPHQPVKIPEPSSLLLLAPALVALRRKKRR
jgi:hypothetical protein